MKKLMSYYEIIIPGVKSPYKHVAIGHMSITELQHVLPIISNNCGDISFISIEEEHLEITNIYIVKIYTGNRITPVSNLYDTLLHILNHYTMSETLSNYINDVLFAYMPEKSGFLYNDRITLHDMLNYLEGMFIRTVSGSNMEKYYRELVNSYTELIGKCCNNAKNFDALMIIGQLIYNDINMDISLQTEIEGVSYGENK